MNNKENQNEANQMHPNNQACEQSPGLATDEARQNEKSSQNRSNQKNPNNPAYYQCRGNSTRPKDWETISEKSKTNGILEARANTAAAMSSEKRRAMGSYTKRVEKVVKEELGKKSMVYKGGSQKKRTNVGKSDLDLKIRTSEPMTRDDRTELGRGLEKEFGKENVDSNHSKIHVVQGEDFTIDIVPSQAEYFPPDFQLDKPGVRPFATNNTGRHAVRNLKEDPDVDDVPGIEIEKTVLAIQQRYKGISLDDIIKKAKTEL